MPIYEIHKKMKTEEFTLTNPEQTYAESRGLWYPVAYGIETMKSAVHTLRNYSEGAPNYTYRIIEIHYRTRTSEGKVK